MTPLSSGVSYTCGTKQILSHKWPVYIDSKQLAELQGHINREMVSEMTWTDFGLYLCKMCH